MVALSQKILNSVMEVGARRATISRAETMTDVFYSMTRLTKKARETFESIRRVNDDGNEWWSSRDLAKVLTYTDYRNFLEVMRKAWTACHNSGQDPNHHFVKSNEMIQTGKGAEREIETWLMSRYACYLAVQNANPSKPIVAQAQTYFALQVRRAEKYLLLKKKRKDCFSVVS